MTRTLSMLALLSLGLAGCVVDRRDAPPPARVYDPCAFTSDCELRADRCFEITVDYGSRLVSDGMCSLSCRDDFDCPRRGACYSIEGAQPICYERCFEDFDCPPGFACVDAIGPRTLDAICLPF